MYTEYYLQGKNSSMKKAGAALSGEFFWSEIKLKVLRLDSFSCTDFHRNQLEGHLKPKMKKFGNYLSGEFFWSRIKFVQVLRLD